MRVLELHLTLKQSRAAKSWAAAAYHTDRVLARGLRGTLLLSGGFFVCQLSSLRASDGCLFATCLRVLKYLPGMRGLELRTGYAATAIGYYSIYRYTRVRSTRT